jgi:hypothetical protein
MLKWIFKTLLFIGFLLNLNHAYSQVINIESKRFLNDTDGWVGNSDFVLSIVKNTQQIISFSNTTRIQYQENKHKFLFLNDIGFVKAGNINFVNAGYQHLRYNIKLQNRITMEAFVQTQYNPILKLDFRFLYGVGPRFKLIKQKNIRIYAAGLFMYEHDIIKNEPLPQQASRASLYISSTFISKQNFELTSTSFYQPKIGEASDFRFANDTSLEFLINKHINFKTSINILYDTKQPIGVPDLVYTIRNGLTFKF